MDSDSKNKKRKVILWDLIGTLGIILEPSEIIYSNQTCGHSCIQSEAEGILMPFNNDYPLNDKEQSIEHKLTKLLYNDQFLTPEKADLVDKVFKNCGFKSISVDRSKLKESHEAWIFVNIKEDKDLYFLKGFGDCKAVITWNNSD